MKKKAAGLSKAAMMVAVLVLALALVFPASAQEREEPTVIPSQQAELEMQLTYAHSSSNRLQVHGYSIYDAIIIGELRVHKIKRDLLMPSLVLRLGLSEETALELLVPLSYRKDDILKSTHTTEDGKPSQQVMDTCGLGDIEVILSHASTIGSKKIPVVTTFGVKTTTGLSPYDALDDEVSLGTGHLGARLGFTTTKVVDPVVFFGTLGYIWNFCREIEGYGVIDPGDSIHYSVGAAYAVTPKLSLNARLEQQFTSATSKDLVFEAGSESVVANFYVGASYELRPGVNLDITVGLGLTEDSPDFTLGLTRLLHRF